MKKLKGKNTIYESLKKRILQFLIIIYPFLPILKEWSLLVGNLIETVLFIFLIFIILERRRGVVRINKSLIYISIIYFVYLFISNGKIYDRLSGFRIYMFYPLLFVSVKKTIDMGILSNEDIARPLMISVIIMSLGAIVQYVLPDIIQNFHSAKNYPILRLKTDFNSFSVYNRSISFMLDPNVLGIYLVFNLIAIHLLKAKISRKLYINLLLFISVILTRSRTALIILVLYLFIHIFQKLIYKKKINKYALIIGFIVCLILFIYLLTNIENINKYLRLDTFFNGNGRFDKNIANVKIFMSQDIINILFGSGLSSGKDTIFENIILLFLNTFGILGTIVTISLIVRLITNYVNRKSIAIIICFVIANLVGDYYSIPQVTYIVVLSLFLSCNVSKDNYLFKI